MSLCASKSKSSGLEGVAAAETALSHVDGAAGRLILCGQDLEEVIATHTFESAAGTFWAVAGDEPPASPATVQAALGEARVAAFLRFEQLSSVLGSLTVAEGLRLGLASLPEAGAASNVSVTAAVPVFAANLARLKAGREPVPPLASNPHAEDFLHMLLGVAPSAETVKALSTYLLTVMDHGMNASTFTARVIASTRAGLTWATVGAFAALTGPIHGGAPEPVLDMLDAIGKPERAAGWIGSALGRGERLMGFGHRVYRVRDPRADILKATLETLGTSGSRLQLAQAIEEAALEALRHHKPDSKIETNVEFYTALLLERLDIPRHAFTSVFAMGRIVGWTAHALEQRRTGRLMRPTSVYIGELPVRAG
jgi:citrate synthase